MHLIEASWLVQLISRDPKSSPFKSYLRGCSSAGFLVLVFCSFLVQVQTRAWISQRFNNPNNSILGSIDALHCNFLCKQIFKTPNFVETLIYFGERGEGLSPCESCHIQASSDTMLIFHMLD